MIALPIGVLVAIYLSEFASKPIAAFVDLLDVMNGIPAIVVGIFVFGVIVVGRGRALSRTFALSILMVPMVARAIQELLALVPGALREASLASALVAGALPSRRRRRRRSAVSHGTARRSRVAGETAPLLFTSSITAVAINTNVTEALRRSPSRSSPTRSRRIRRAGALVDVCARPDQAASCSSRA